MDKNIYAVILAGGSGTRFWPRSRKKNPKQFLNINGPKSLLQQTLLRIKSRIKGSNVCIVTNKIFKSKIIKQTSDIKIPARNILLEPEGRNTAPAICWAAANLYRKNKEAVMIVLPSDHIILNKENFLKDLDAAVNLAKQDYLVTLGIVPTRPDTGYGYLKTKNTKTGSKAVIKVEKFTEKPSPKRAEKFLKEKCYLWNSGMFIWKCEAILDAFKIHLPEVYSFFDKNKTTADIKNKWHTLPNISVDYGILEKSNNVVTVPAHNIGWSDLGSWESVDEVADKGKDGNVLNGDIISIDCSNSYILGDKRIIAAIGLQDIVVVDTPDAILICRKEFSQDVKNIVSVLKEKKRDKLI